MSTFQSMPTASGRADVDWIGYDDGSRSLPERGGQRPPRRRQRDEAATRRATRSQKSGRAFPNVWNPRAKALSKTESQSSALATPVSCKKDGRRAGYLLSFLYEYEEIIRNGFQQALQLQRRGRRPTQSASGLRLQEREQEVLWGTFGSGFVELDPDNFLNLTSLFSRVSDNKTITQLGVAKTPASKIASRPRRTASTSSVELMFFNQLTGDHRNLGETKVGSSGMPRRAWAAAIEPDRRDIQQFKPRRQLVTSATRYYADLNQVLRSAERACAVSLWRRFESHGLRDRWRGLGVYEKRDFAARRFVQQQPGGASFHRRPGSSLRPIRPRNLDHHSNEITNRRQLQRPATLSYGGYLQLETPMAAWLKFLGFSVSRCSAQQVQIVRARSRRSASPPLPPTSRSRTRIARTSTRLPSANFAFTINPKMFVKLGYGMTVIRPAIRELAPLLLRRFPSRLVHYGKS